MEKDYTAKLARQGITPSWFEEIVLDTLRLADPQNTLMLVGVAGSMFLFFSRFRFYLSLLSCVPFPCLNLSHSFSLPRSCHAPRPRFGST